MSAVWRIEPLSKTHDRSQFACGVPALDEYLARFARQNHESGVAKTFVAVAPDSPRRVLQRVLDCDTGLGVLRLADAGYDIALAAKSRHGLGLASETASR